MTHKLLEAEMAAIETRILAQLDLALKGLVAAVNLYEKVVEARREGKDAVGIDHIDGLITASIRVRDVIEGKKILR